MVYIPHIYRPNSGLTISPFSSKKGGYDISWQMAANFNHISCWLNTDVNHLFFKTASTSRCWPEVFCRVPLESLQKERVCSKPPHSHFKNRKSLHVHSIDTTLSPLPSFSVSQVRGVTDVAVKSLLLWAFLCSCSADTMQTQREVCL